MKSRLEKFKLNIITSLLMQGVTLIVGLIIPQAIIKNYGSELYGATASIAQFLSYITLLQGGIGGVARAALYKPLSENNGYVIGSIMEEIRKYFRVIAIAFVLYTIIIASSYKYISKIDILDWTSTFLLVIVLSISTLSEYYFGITNSIFLQAQQKNYIINTLSIFSKIINAVLVIVLINMGCNIITLKFISSIVFIVKPLVLAWYTKKSCALVYKKSKEKYLTQKWEGLGQHIAFFLHSNTDIVILTLFGNLKLVAVYSVYNMVISNIKNVALSFVTDVEALLGDMYSRGEIEKLRKTFDYYDVLMSIIAGTLFSVTIVMVIPFIRIYTNSVKDVNYIQPLFAVIILLAEYLYCLRSHYHHMVIAVGHFKQTRWAAYGEAVINIIFSLVLVAKYKLVGVAFATLASIIFRFIYYAIYLSRNIIKRPVKKFIKMLSINVFILVVNSLLGNTIINTLGCGTYLQWTISAGAVFVVTTIITVLINMILNYTIFKEILNNYLLRFRRKL